MNHQAQESPWGVIFDVDGTMVDNAAWHARAWVEFGRQNGLPITEEYYRERIHSRGNDEILRGLFQKDVTRAELDAWAWEKESVYRSLYRPHVRPNPGLYEFVTALHRGGVPMAAASNSPLPNVTMVLGELGLRHHFPVVLAQNDTRPTKPNPDIFLEAAALLGLPPSRCLVLEDSVSGFGAAENAGMPYVVVAGGANEACLAHGARACAVYQDFAGLSVARLRAFVM